MAKPSYWELLRDPRWQKKRLEVMERDEFTCQQCFDSTSTLNVHHRAYVKGRDPWDYPNESLVTLCEPCHAEESMVSEAFHNFLIKVWPSYSFGQDTIRLSNLADAIAVGLAGGSVSPYDHDAWMAAIGGLTAVFSQLPDPQNNDVVKRLLEVFKVMQQPAQEGGE